MFGTSVPGVQIKTAACVKWDVGHLQHISWRCLLPWAFLDINWYPYKCRLWSFMHSLCCFQRICRFSFQTCFTLMVCTESNPLVLSGEETCRHRCFVPACIQRKTSIICYQRVLRFFRVSCDADQDQIWYPQSEGVLGDRIFSLSLLVRSVVSQYFLFWRSTCHSRL